MTASASPQRLPTVTGFAIRCAFAALQERDLPVRPLFLRAGLSDPLFANPRRRVSAAAQGEFLEYAAEVGGRYGFRTSPRRTVKPPRRRTALLCSDSRKRSRRGLGALCPLLPYPQRKRALQVGSQPHGRYGRVQLRRSFTKSGEAEYRVLARPCRQDSPSGHRSLHPADPSRMPSSTHRRPRGIRALLRLPGQVLGTVRPVGIH